MYINKDTFVGIHYDVFKSAVFVDRMANDLIKRYNISKKRALYIMNKVSDYNPKNEKEAYQIVDKILKGELL